MKWFFYLFTIACVNSYVDMTWVKVAFPTFWVRISSKSLSNLATFLRRCKEMALYNSVTPGWVTRVQGCVPNVKSLIIIVSQWLITDHHWSHPWTGHSLIAICFVPPKHIFVVHLKLSSLLYLQVIKVSFIHVYILITFSFFPQGS